MNTSTYEMFLKTSLRSILCNNNKYIRWDKEELDKIQPQANDLAVEAFILNIKMKKK